MLGSLGLDFLFFVSRNLLRHQDFQYSWQQFLKRYLRGEIYSLRLPRNSASLASQLLPLLSISPTNVTNNLSFPLSIYRHKHIQMCWVTMMIQRLTLRFRIICTPSCCLRTINAAVFDPLKAVSGQELGYLKDIFSVINLCRHLGHLGKSIFICLHLLKYR